MESLPLFVTNKERRYFFLFILSVFLINIVFYHIEFTKFKSEEVLQTQASIINIYPKKDYNVIKIKTKDFICFTTSSKEDNLTKFQNINLYLVTKDINFYYYLKGFYTNSFNITPLYINTNFKYSIYQDIIFQHTSDKSNHISSLYSALFLAIPFQSDLRDKFAAFGVSHLIAISGFHLGIISLVLYFLLNLLYSRVHQKYFPYRNKKYDIIIVTILVMLSYLIFVDVVPSLLRAFTMFVFGIFLLRNNIKVISFESLFIIICIVITLFPKLLFSLSLWFSIAGVFYIFLFIHYFKNLNKYVQIILFNFWIYFAINPITHYFFGTTAIEQLYSPMATLLFTIFYPLTALLHIIQLGGVLDNILLYILNITLEIKEVFTPLWFFIIYIMVSLGSIFNKYIFYILNILFIVFNLWLYVVLF